LQNKAFILALPYLLAIVFCTVVTIIQQVFYPETGAWIVAFLGILGLLTFFALIKLQAYNNKYYNDKK
jgi:hypothetical protein